MKEAIFSFDFPVFFFWVSVYTCQASKSCGTWFVSAKLFQNLKFTKKNTHKKKQLLSSRALFFAFTVLADAIFKPYEDPFHLQSILDQPELSEPGGSHRPAEWSDVHSHRYPESGVSSDPHYLRIKCFPRRCLALSSVWRRIWRKGSQGSAGRVSLECFWSPRWLQSPEPGWRPNFFAVCFPFAWLWIGWTLSPLGFASRFPCLLPGSPLE